MKKGDLSIKTFPTNKENPFLKQAIEEIDHHVVKKWQNSTSTSKKAILTAVDNDGEPVGYTSFVRQIKVDDDKFTKLYLAQFEAFFELSQAGIRVFGYIMTCMKPRKDMIAFSIKDCMEYTKYKSRATVYKGLTELLRGGIIARGKEDWQYFINPLIMWNGDRVTFVNDYVKKSAVKGIEEETENLTPKQLEYFEHPANEDAAMQERLQGRLASLTADLANPHTLEETKNIKSRIEGLKRKLEDIRDSEEAEKQRPESWLDLPENDPDYQFMVEHLRKQWYKTHQAKEQDMFKPNPNAKPIPYK